MFALGTFINNVKSDHANSINLGVGMKLIHVANDGSPLVRKVKQVSSVLCSCIVSHDLDLGCSCICLNVCQPF